jgi:GNAT superfamily N-acetyltransferase
MESKSPLPQHDDQLVVRRLEFVDPPLAQQLCALFDEGVAWDVNQGLRFLSDPANLLLVAFWGDAPCGFATAHRLPRFDRRQASVLLYEIGVDEPFQRRGIGTALVEAVKRWATDVGADEVWVPTEPANDAARALYLATGGQEDQAGVTMFAYPLPHGA